MEQANEALGGHGVEAIRGEEHHVDNYHFDIIATYVNFGDTYVTTLLYDTEAHTFYLTSYGDWLEAWEQEHPREVEEEEEPETDQISTWGPARWDNPPLIAMLRSVEGDEVAVHFWDDRPFGVAFSAVMGDGSFSAQQIVRRPSDEPYIYEWVELVERFRKPNVDVVSVAFTTRDVTINRDQFSLLRVAMDSFLERGSRNQADVFLHAPPVLWTCNELVADWYEERGEAIVRVFTGQDVEHVRAGNEPLEVWSARSPEVEQLIEDGFIKWKRDDTVREYLQSIGVCRRS
jgi:hypothetical protein